MPADLIVYALVAAGLIFWLRSVLGTRHGEEREHPNPFLAADPDEKNDHGHAAIDQPAGMEENIIALAKEPRRNYGVDNKTAENGLIDIAKADKDFDIDFFLEGAQDAFAMIVESFAEGDRETLNNLLGPQVYEAFEAAIKQREDQGHVEVADIHAIRKAYVTQARLEGKMAYITVRFTAEETTVTRDKDGEIISGHPDKVVEMNDIWTFGRDIKSKDPSWLVYETRSDIEEDNERIPDTH